jgi:hypothetical protein
LDHPVWFRGTRSQDSGTAPTRHGFSYTGHWCIEEFLESLDDTLRLFMVRKMTTSLEYFQKTVVDHVNQFSCMRDWNNSIKVSPEKSNGRQIRNFMSMLKKCPGLTSPIDDITHCPAKGARGALL